MSAHVAPHRWADAFAGALSEREVAEMERHAERCSRCARTRDRVNSASQSFPALRAQSAPELSWDSVRARVHWTVSKERRQPRHSRLVPALAASALAAGALAIAAITGGIAPAPATLPARPAVAEPASAPMPAATPLGALIVRERGEHVMIDGLDRRGDLDVVVTAGTRIATGRGSVDIQFDVDSALALGPGSDLTVVRLDSERIELALVTGTLDVTVARRPPEQRFVVRAGDREIEVRGTQFRVSHDARTTRVACAHGRVAVRDGASEVEVGSARKLEVSAASRIASTTPRELSPSERRELADALPLRLPGWTDAAQLAKTSAALEVATSGTPDVRVDGIEVGQGPLRVRVMPGRHTVETADRAGRFRRAGWVDVVAGAPARLAVHPEVTSPRGGAAARRRQLRAGIDRARLAGCTRALTKAGVTDTYVRIEISIDESGAVEFLNIVDTDLASSTAACVHAVLADVRFAPGPAATFHDKLDL